MIANATRHAEDELRGLRAMVQPDPAPRLGLTAQELEEVLVALDDRADVVPVDRRARLQRARIAAELELARVLADGR